MKKRIQRKLNSNKGLTLVEMLCSCLILVMLSTVVSTGLDMAAKSYGRMVAENEAQVLLSSVSTVLSDELRYAVDDKGGVLLKQPPSDLADPADPAYPKFVFESDTYWNNGYKTAMYISNSGETKGCLVVKKAQINAAGNVTLEGIEYHMLPKSDYGKSAIRGAQYEIESIEINKYVNASTNETKFTYKITIKRGTGPSVEAEGTVKNMPHEPETSP